MKRTPMSCKGCFHNIGFDACQKDAAACRADGYSGYRFHDFVGVAQYITENKINCFYASLDEEGGVRLEVRE